MVMQTRLIVTLSVLLCVVNYTLDDACIRVYLASAQHTLQDTEGLKFEGLAKISNKLVVNYPVPE